MKRIILLLGGIKWNRNMMMQNLMILSDNINSEEKSC